VQYGKFDWSTSALGQKRTWDCRSLMSALPPKADITGGQSDVRFAPIADIGQCRVDVGFTYKSRHPCPKEKGPAQWPVPPIDFKRKELFKLDFGQVIPPGVPRHHFAYQEPRRAVLAPARNHLLFRALRDEQWVLWIDADVIEYPADIVQRLIALDSDIVHPHCVLEYGGKSFDLNAWRDNGRLHMEDLRGSGRVRLDSVGGTMLLVRADRHRDGLVFPPFFYGGRSRWVRSPHPERGTKVGEIETEGLGVMAKDMGIECWGLPDLEILHAR
jgi:Anp1